MAFHNGISRSLYLSLAFFSFPGCFSSQTQCAQRNFLWALSSLNRTTHYVNKEASQDSLCKGKKKKCEASAVEVSWAGRSGVLPNQTAELLQIRQSVACRRLKRSIVRAISASGGNRISLICTAVSWNSRRSTSRVTAQRFFPRTAWTRTFSWNYIIAYMLSGLWRHNHEQKST